MSDVSVLQSVSEPVPGNRLGPDDLKEMLHLMLRIRRFEVDLQVEQVLAFYRGQWPDEFAESEMPPWKMIGSRQGDEFFNVQVQAKGRNKSWGYLSVSDLPKRVDQKQYSLQMGKHFPMMSGSQIINDQLDKNVGKTGRTLLIFNRFSVSANTKFYRNHFRSQGWDLIMDQQTGGTEPGQALYFRRDHESLALTINAQDNRTSIVANQVSRGLLNW